MTVPHFTTTPVLFADREDTGARVSHSTKLDLVSLQLSHHKLAIFFEIAPPHPRYSLQLVGHLNEELLRVLQNEARPKVKIRQRIDKPAPVKKIAILSHKRRIRRSSERCVVSDQLR